MKRLSKQNNKRINKKMGSLSHKIAPLKKSIEAIKENKNAI